MIVLLARLKQAAGWVLGLLASVAVVVAVVLGLRRRRPSGAVEIEGVIERTRRMRDVAEARAAVQIAATRATHAAVRDELIDVLNDQDEDRQAQRLLAMAKRLKDDP